MQKTIYGLLAVLIAGCASLNSAMTPGISTSFDQYDESIIIIQPPVNATTGLAEDWHLLGFEWNQKYSDKVFLLVGVSGIKNIMGVAFKIGDYEIIGKEASTLTEYGDWSTRRFVISKSDFIIMANADTVKMKVSSIDTYTVSSFGQSQQLAVVSSKFKPFLEKIEETENPQVVNQQGQDEEEY